MPRTQTISSSPPAEPRTLQIDRVIVPRLYNRTNIIYRSSAEEIQIYPYYLWAVQPSDMITDFIEKHFNESNLFTKISREYLDVRPDYRLESTVQALEQYSYRDVWYGHLAMIVRLIRVTDGQQVWQHAFDERRRVWQSDMVNTVRALSQTLESQMVTVTNGLDAFFRAASGDTIQAASESTPIEETETELRPGDQSTPFLDKDAYILIPVRGAATVADSTEER